MYDVCMMSVNVRHLFSPLHGEYYDNLFIHWRPAGDWYQEPFNMGARSRASPITIEDIKRIN